MAPVIHSVPQWIFHQVKRITTGKKVSPPDPTGKHEIIIVGGGVAGLYTAYQLQKQGITDVVVLEGRPVVGGRITTQRDPEDKQPMFNNFGWRVGDVNKEMIALAKELDITLIPQVTPPEDTKKAEQGQCRHGPAGHVCR